LKISISKIYRSQEVVEKEVAGYKIIADLLDIFVTALNNHHLGAPTNYDRLLLNLLPKEFMTTSVSTYERIMAICTYVSRMSDSYAIRIHKKIQGSII
jgi:dGTPase